MKAVKIPLIALGACVLALAAAALVLVASWSGFEPHQVVGSRAEDTGGTLAELTEAWLMDYAEGLRGWGIPFSWQIRDMEVESTEDLGDNFVQISYQFRTLLRHPRFADDFDAYALDAGGRDYGGQMVVRWEQAGDSWHITEAMRPAAWQIMYDPEIQAEREQPETVHFDPETYAGLPYLIREEHLYVTYDQGASYIEVPDGYEAVCRLANGSAQERLSRNSCIITPELTAFLVYDDDPVSPRAYLYFSQDQGQSWQQNFIGYGYKANSFLSQTERGIYATFAADRTLGSDYYQTCFSSDLVNWESVPLPSHARNYTCAYWPEDGVGYYSGTTTSELVTNGDGSAQERTYSNNFFATFDGGERYSMLTFPEVADYMIGDIFPFDTLDEMYDQDGVRYMVVGQGDDGDLTQDGKQVKLLYSSENSRDFTFVESFVDPVVFAG